MSSPYYDYRGKGTATGVHMKRRPPRRNFVLIVAGVLTVATVILLVKVGTSGGPGIIVPSTRLDGQTSLLTESPSSGPASPQKAGSPPAGEAGSMETAKEQAAVQKLIDYGLPIYCGGGNKRLVALTFDDGPGPFTEYTMDTLKSAHATATFFLVGKLFASPVNQRLAKAESKFAVVADHTFTHAALAGAPHSQVKSEILHARKVIEKATGQTVNLYRPPLGSHDAYVDRFVNDKGMLEILWSLDSRDAIGANTEQIIRNIKKGISPGDIILMHENRGTTRNALPEILQIVQDAGLTPVTVPELLAKDPPTHKQIKRHSCAEGPLETST